MDQNDRRGGIAQADRPRATREQLRGAIDMLEPMLEIVPAFYVAPDGSSSIPDGAVEYVRGALGRVRDARCIELHVDGVLFLGVDIGDESDGEEVAEDGEPPAVNASDAPSLEAAIRTTLERNDYPELVVKPLAKTEPAPQPKPVAKVVTGRDRDRNRRR